MPSQDKKRYIAYLAALSIFASLIENAIPRPFPFFRLGLANLPLLMSINLLTFPEYLLLALGKWIATALINGTLFSQLGLFSLASTAASALVMYGASKLFKSKVSNYAISPLGAAASTIAQVSVATYFLGNGVLKLLPVMMTLSLVTSIILAFLSYKLTLPESVPEMKNLADKNAGYIPSLAILFTVVFSSAINNFIVLTLLFLFAILLQLSLTRRVKVLPYLITIISIMLVNLITPNGKVLWGFITRGALITGYTRGIKLALAVSLSQGLTKVLPPLSGFTNNILSYYAALYSTFKLTSGNVLDRVNQTLRMPAVPKDKNEKEINLTYSTIFSIVILLLSLFSLLYLS